MEQRFGLTRKKILAQFVVHCESHVQNIETVVLVIRVFLMYFFERKKKKKKPILSHLYFFLDNSEIPATSWTYANCQTT